ncbi:MAG: hypothetical protein J3Q66DRAFT_373809 [Benniella sp.]|nr:MAG: hypothetical protein J3Q66DRAFT_373809 [Benniella sp.]
MPPSLSSPTFALLILTLTLFCVSFCSPVLAQKFKPQPDSDKCSAFAEGQAFYLLGGLRNENFMLDLSVPWNTSDPVAKKLQGGLLVNGHGCTMTNDGDLFVLTAGAGFIYNPRSDAWTTLSHNALITSTRIEFGATDPETGIIYIMDNDIPKSQMTMYSIDPRTKDVTTSIVPRTLVPLSFDGIAWSEYLKSMVTVVSYSESPVSIFTPSKVNEPSKGWSAFATTGQEGSRLIFHCIAPARSGSIMVFLGETSRDISVIPETNVFFLDLTTRSWRIGPTIPTTSLSMLSMSGCSCAVSGDQFIVWGGNGVGSLISNRTLVLDMNAGTWVSRYVPPPPRPTTTASQPTQSPTPHTSTGITSSNDKKLVSIIVAVAGTVLALI